MPTTPHTTLLEILSRPVTGDASGIKVTLEHTISPLITHARKDAIALGGASTDDIKATPEDIKAGDRIYHEALAYIKDAIAPAMVKVSPHDILINDTFCKTLFTYAYPDFLEGNWLSPLINWDSKFDVSIFVYPTDAQQVMKYLRKRLTELQSEKYLNQER